MPKIASATSASAAPTLDTPDIRANVLDTLGDTPLVRLNAVTRGFERR